MLSIEIRQMRFPGVSEALIEGFMMSFTPGTFISVLGESGVGKTTFLRIVAGLEKRFDGRVEMNGNTVTKPSRNIQMIFQDHRLMPWKTALENVTFSAGSSASEANDAAVECMERFGLLERMNDWPKNLSGGEKTRVALARAFVTNPMILLLDEPFSGVDVSNRHRIQKLLLENLLKNPCISIMVTHDIEDAIRLSDQILIVGKRFDIITSIDLEPEPFQRSLTTKQRELYFRVSELLSS